VKVAKCNTLKLKDTFKLLAEIAIFLNPEPRQQTSEQGFGVLAPLGQRLQSLLQVLIGRRKTYITHGDLHAARQRFDFLKVSHDTLLYRRGFVRVLNRRVAVENGKYHHDNHQNANYGHSEKLGSDTNARQTKHRGLPEFRRHRRKAACSTSAKLSGRLIIGGY